MGCIAFSANIPNFTYIYFAHFVILLNKQTYQILHLFGQRTTFYIHLFCTLATLAPP
jgi:hypothetical protein